MKLTETERTELYALTDDAKAQIRSIVGDLDLTPEQTRIAEPLLNGLFGLGVHLGLVHAHSAVNELLEASHQMDIPS